MTLKQHCLLNTRHASESDKLSELLREAGAVVFEFALFRVKFLDVRESLLPAFRKASWILFTSANGVRAAAECLEGGGEDAPELFKRPCAAVGRATAQACTESGFDVKFVSPVENAEGFAHAFADFLLASGQPPEELLLVHGETFERTILTELSTRFPGAIKDIAVYCAIPVEHSAEEISDLSERVLTEPQKPGWSIEGTLAASPGAIRALADTVARVSDGPALLERLQHLPLFVIGPRTEEAARVCGFRAVRAARGPSMEELKAEVLCYFADCSR